MNNDFVERLQLAEYETARARQRVLARAKKVGLTRVMLFNSYGHIEPGHLDLAETRRRAALMTTATKEFKAAGLGVGINVIATIGMNLSPPRAQPLPYQHLVDFDGVVFRETYCPIDPGFQAYTAETYATYAAVEEIDEVWIDDDYRYKNKAAQCFCPQHLAAFGRVSGREWTREQLVAALGSASPLPNDVAVRWGELQNRVLVDCARAIAAAVHRVAPRVRMGFMPPSLDLMFYGGACVAEIGRVLNPTTRGLARPEYGGYSDIDRVVWGAYAPTWAMRRVFGEAYEGWPELETWPGTGYNHSARVVQMKLAWGAIHGYVSTTLSGARLDQPVLKAIARAKAQIAAITPFVTSPEWVAQGVSLELSENVIGLRPKVQDVINVGKHAARVLARLGLPLWPSGGGGRILVGNAPLARQEELAGFAREGMILDRDAAEMIESMGRVDILGGARLLALPGFPAAERFAKSPLNGAAAGQVKTLEALALVRRDLVVYQLPDSPEFTPLCWLLDQDQQPLGVSVWAREWPGGRVVVVPFRLNDPTAEQGVVTAWRKTQLEAALAWASGKALPVRFGYGEAYDVQVVYRQHRAGDRVFVGLANFGLDDATGFSLELPALAEASTVEVRMLDQQGAWRTATRPLGAGGRLEIRGSLGIPDQEVRAYEIIRQG